MFNWIKTKLIAQVIQKNRIKIYTLEINEQSERVSKMDLILLHYFLNFTPSIDGLFCSIRTWRDDVFVNISCKSNQQNWDFCTEKLLTVSELLSDRNETAINDFLWLVVDDEFYERNHTFSEIVTHVVNFINERRKENQSICSKNSMIFFEQNCTINNYKIIWGQENRLNCLIYDIG